ncbi:MAG: hypothetical protein ACMUIU_08455 [bacterium]
MPDPEEIIFESPASDPEDKIWLEQGQKLLEGSFDAVHDAAKSFLTGLEIITGIYLGILGFADFIPDNMNFAVKIIFLIPLILWLIAIYCTLQVLMSKKLTINIHAPDDIRDKIQQLLLEKQRHMKWAFGTFSIGLIAVFLLFILRVYL